MLHNYIAMLYFILALVLIVGIYICINDAKEKKESKSALKKNLSIVESWGSDFTPNKTIKSPDDLFVIKFDESHEKIAVISNEGVLSIPFKDVISVERIENGVTKFRKSIAETVGGAIIGGAIAGGAGMVVGGLSGSTEGSKKITSLSVKVTINDLSHPSITFPLPLGEALAFAKSFKVAEELVDTFKVIISRNSNRIN